VGGLYTSRGEKGLTIREIIAEQRRRSRSSNAAERFVAALLIPGVLRERLRGLTDFQLGQVFDREVCPNVSVLVPELTICMEAAERLLRRRVIRFMPRRRSRALQNEGEHILHAESALYWARIPHLLLPFQRDRFASNTFMVPCVAEARDRLCQAGFRETPRSPTVLIDIQTRRSIRLHENRT
jgi:hypothetical protein